MLLGRSKKWPRIGKPSARSFLRRRLLAPDTLTCRVDRDGPVLLSYFGSLGLGRVSEPDRVEGTSLRVASLLDIAGTKLAVVQKRAEMKDYIDIDAILQEGIDLATALSAARVVYGHAFNPLVTLKALCYFDDVPELRDDVKGRLGKAAASVDVATLPALSPWEAAVDTGNAQ